MPCTLACQDGDKTIPLFQGPKLERKFSRALGDEERKKIQQDDRRKMTDEAVEKAKINRARSANPAFQRLRSAGWDVVKDLQSSHHEDQATGRAEVGNRASRAASLTRSVSISKAHSKAAALAAGHRRLACEGKPIEALTATVAAREYEAIEALTPALMAARRRRCLQHPMS